MWRDIPMSRAAKSAGPISQSVSRPRKRGILGGPTDSPEPDIGMSGHLSGGFHASRDDSLCHHSEFLRYVRDRFDGTIEMLPLVRGADLTPQTSLSLRHNRKSKTGHADPPIQELG